MMTKLVLAMASAAVAVASGEVYFHETFDDAAWSSRWVASTAKPASELGAFVQTSGADYVDPKDKGLKTSEDARFYALSAKLSKPLDNTNKDLYVSYVVQHEQALDCGGAYLKLLPTDTDQTKFGGDSPYAIMFGPDICGMTKKTHAILNYTRPKKTESVNMDHKSDIRAESDMDGHVYSFILKKDNTYDVKIDGKSVQSGLLAENWPFAAPKEIEDPDVSKPADWVDSPKMVDPSAKKPDGYDDVPEMIPDSDAVKPEDWDEDDDGEWEPSQINNPDYKGPWVAPMIDNPDYKGPWVHPKIANPDYVEDKTMYNVAKNVGVVGFELWQVKSGTLFDDIIVTDDVSAFTKHEDAAVAKVAANKAKKDAKLEADRKAAEAKAKEEEAKTKDADKDAKTTAADDEDVDEKDEL